MTPKARILIVDDSGSLKPVCEVLLHEKFEVASAASAEEALDLLECQDVDLVVSSVKLSGMSGSDLLCELHEWDSALPVILIGEGGEEKDWLGAFHANAFAMFPKNFRRDAFLKAVYRAVREKIAVPI